MTDSLLRNRRLLRDRFVERLLGLRPESVLDVGCGGGELLTAATQAGIAATGIEPDPQAVAALTARGFHAIAADATALPARDSGYDWVTMRHVLHHLRDPGAALREMLRACRRGLLLAEPWYETSLPCQRVALDCDRWLNVQLQRRGRLHRDMLGAGDMLRLLPGIGPGDVAIEHHLFWNRRELEHLRAELTGALDDLPASAPERQQAEALLARAAAEGVTWNGSVVVVVRKPG